MPYVQKERNANFNGRKKCIIIALIDQRGWQPRCRKDGADMKNPTVIWLLLMALWLWLILGPLIVSARGNASIINTRVCPRSAG
jgi:hypothetical protein